MAVGLAPLGGRLFVRADVKVDKEEEVARKKRTAKDRSTLGTRASTQVGEHRPVGSAKVRVT
jgi:hypothetical protein